MSSGIRTVLVTLVLTLAAAFAGVWAGERYFGGHAPVGASLHDLVHDELTLSPAQSRRLDIIEDDFAVERKRLELEIRTANAELAAAIRAEHRFGPQTTRAIDHFHDAMGRLQKLTIAHVFEMRSVLTPVQQRRFDEVVVEALTAEAK